MGYNHIGSSDRLYMTFVWNSQIEKAIKLAVSAHEGQFRKGIKIPYISHLFSVALLLQKAGATDEQIIAGILHDTVEDTYLEIKDIEIEFGSKIASLVFACSEENPKAPWQERKEKTLICLRSSSEEVKLIVCADKFHNLLSIKDDLGKFEEKAFWEFFGKGREYQAWYYHSLAEIFLENQDPLTCNPLFLEFDKTVKDFF